MHNATSNNMTKFSIPLNNIVMNNSSESPLNLYSESPHSSTKSIHTTNNSELYSKISDLFNDENTSDDHFQLLESSSSSNKESIKKLEH